MCEGLRRTWKAVNPMETASSSQRADVKCWKMTRGESSCSTYKSTKRGVATESTFVPYFSVAAATAAGSTRPFECR